MMIYAYEYYICYLLLAQIIFMQAPSIEVLKMMGPCLLSCLIAYTTYPFLKVESYIKDRRASLRRMGFLAAAAPLKNHWDLPQSLRMSFYP